MTAAIDYTGVKQGMIYVSHKIIQEVRKNHETLWHCECDCGETATLSSNQLRGGRSDCGCIVPIIRTCGTKGRKTNRSPTITLKLHPLIDEYLYKHQVRDAICAEQLWKGGDNVVYLLPRQV